MRKILAVVISALFALLPLSVTSIAVNDETNNKSLDAFVADLSELVNRSYVTGMQSGAPIKYGASLDCVPEVKQESDEYTNRVVVKSTQKLNPLDSVNYIYGYNDLHILQFDNRESVLKAIEYYKNLSFVEYVEEDAYLHEAVVDDGNDIVFDAAVEYPTAVQSGLFGYATAKIESDGFDVDIAVIDSGIELNHDFLKDRVIDSGVDVINDSGTANDDRGHGTHVAGIIVANTLDNVTVHAYKALNSSGTGTATQISLAIDAAIEDEVDIINLSMSMKGTSTTLKKAVQKAYSAGICVIVAAGNNRTNISNTTYSPASFDECITVMSCSNAKKILDTSNYGTPCDFAAPGENILSTYIGNCYKLSTGTSMASPFVCAAAAYLLAKDDTLTPEEIRIALGQNVEDCVGTPTGKCVIPSTKILIDDFASAPEFITESGEFVGSIYVEIVDSDDADVYYYLNNNSETVKLYTEPILITETAKVSAFTVQVGKVNSITKTVAFTKLDSASVSDYVIVDNTLVAYNGTQTSVSVPLSFYGKMIRKIGANAFKDNKQITDITLGAGVCEVGDSAFSGCENLLTFNAPYVKYIRDNAFEDCTNLLNVFLSNVEYIGERAFANTSMLAESYMPLVKTIEANAFNGSGISFLLISNAETIGDYAFANCYNLEQAVVSATQIGEGAFYYCSNLTKISAFNLKVIPASCFQQCILLESFEFPLVTVVDASAFENCISIQVFDFPSLATVKERAFASTGLISIESDSLTSFSSDSFADCLSINQISLGGMEKVDFKDFAACKNLTKLILPNTKDIIFPEGGLNIIFPNLTTFSGENIVSLPDRAFMGCYYLKSINIPNVKTIGSHTFKNCVNLASSTPFSCYAEEIGIGAFDGIAFSQLNLINLKEINCDIFGSSVESITTLNMPNLENLSNFTLSSFTKLTTLKLDSIKNINENVFVGCSRIKTLSLNSLEDISNVSFTSMPDLEKLTATSLKEIPEKTFYKNTIIKSLTFGSVTKIGVSAFEGCSTLNYINNGLTPVELAEKAFYGCHEYNIKNTYYGQINIKAIGRDALNGTISGWSFVEFDELVRVDSNGFNGIYCQNSTFEKIEIMHDVPENGNVLIGSKIVDFSVDATNTSTIYSAAGTVASAYCIANGIKYIEFNETNAIVNNTPNVYFINDFRVTFQIIGFNLEYSWYGCNLKDCSDAVLLEKNDYNYFRAYEGLGEPDQYKYYYCIARSVENGNVMYVKSNVIKNAFLCIVPQSPDVGIDDFYNFIYSYGANGAEMLSDVYIDSEDCVVIPSYQFNSVDVYGTGSMVKIVDGENVIKTFTFVLIGDVNGDGVVDSLDCVAVGLVINDKGTFNKKYHKYAAEMLDGSHGVSVSDYQAVVNKALSN